MSNYSINAVSNNYNRSIYTNHSSSISNNYDFSSLLSNITNVPLGRQSNVSESRNYNNPNNCTIHGTNYLNSTFPITNVNIDNSRETKTQKAIEMAKSYLGGKYVWGATGPDAFDCSGFTQYIYKHAYGKTIPRVSYEQAKFGEKVNRNELQPGDLIFFDTMNKGRVSHVGIYIGNNKFIHASNSRTGIIESELKGYYEKKYLGARRP